MKTSLLAKYGFAKPFRIRDEAADNVVDVVKYCRTDGTVGSMQIPLATLHQKYPLLALLRNDDAKLPDGKELDDLIAALAKEIPRKRKTRRARCGWIDPANFIIGERVVGLNPTDAISPWSDSTKLGPCPLAVSGSLDEWKRGVAAPAAWSSLIILTISTGFAGTLLGPLNMPSRAIVITGKTRVGKTAATLAGVSTLGIGSEGDMSTWKITNARLGEALPAYNDIAIAIDDIKNMGGGEADKIKRLDELAYLIASGHEAERHSSFQGGAGPGKWRLFLITQYEKSLHETSKDARVVRPGGATLRAIDVPATEPGVGHIFDLYPGNAADPLRATWRADFFKKLIDSCKAAHGAAIDAFLASLTEDRDAAIAKAQAAISDFCKRVRHDADGDEALDLARTFGVIFAAASLAIAFKVLPWSRENAMDAIARCYRRARAELRDEGLLIQQGVELLKTFSRSLPRLSRKGTPPLNYDAVEGYREDVGNARKFVIKKAAFNNVFSSVQQQTLVTQHMLDKGWLARRSVKAPGAAAEPKEQVVWPDGERRHSIELLVPIKRNAT